MHLISCAVVLVFLPGIIQGLRCYSCQSSGDIDPRCEKNPQALAVINCDKKYCTIFRQEFRDPKGRVNSFNRGCEEKPIYTNNVVTDSNWVSYYRSCTSDLCNSWDGVSSSGGGGSGGSGGGGGGGGGGWLNPDNGGSGGGGAILVPGTGGASACTANVATVVLTAFAVVFGFRWL